MSHSSANLSVFLMNLALEDLKIPHIQNLPCSNSEACRKLLQACPYTPSIATDPFHALQSKL